MNRKSCCKFICPDTVPVITVRRLESVRRAAREGARDGAIGWGTALQAGSIPDGFIGIFHWHNPSGRSMALGLTEPLNRTEYQEYFLGVKVAGA